MSTEASTHRLLVSALASAIAWDDGTVRAADGFGTLEPAPLLGDIQPDVVADGADGAIIIGEAKTGEGIGGADTVRRLQHLSDWARHQPEEVRLVLAVPAGLRDQAVTAAVRAGWDEDGFRVFEAAVED